MVMVVNPGDNSMIMTAICIGKMIQGDGKGNRVEIVNFALNASFNPLESFSINVPEGSSEIFKLLREYNISFTPRT